jgi:hypothetical protein
MDFADVELHGRYRYLAPVEGSLELVVQLKTIVAGLLATPDDLYWQPTELGLGIDFLDGVATSVMNRVGNDSVSFEATVMVAMIDLSIESYVDVGVHILCCYLGTRHFGKINSRRRSLNSIVVQQCGLPDVVEQLKSSGTGPMSSTGARWEKRELPGLLTVVVTG